MKKEEMREGREEHLEEEIDIKFLTEFVFIKMYILSISYYFFCIHLIDFMIKR